MHLILSIAAPLYCADTLHFQMQRAMMLMNRKSRETDLAGNEVKLLQEKVDKLMDGFKKLKLENTQLRAGGAVRSPSHSLFHS